MKNYWRNASIVGIIIYLIVTYLFGGLRIEGLLFTLIPALIFFAPLWWVIARVSKSIFESRLSTWSKGTLIGGIVYVFLMIVFIFGQIGSGGDTGAGSDIIITIMPSIWIYLFLFDGSSVPEYFLLIDLAVYCLLGGIAGYSFYPNRKQKNDVK